MQSSSGPTELPDDLPLRAAAASLLLSVVSLIEAGEYDLALELLPRAYLEVRTALDVDEEWPEPRNLVLIQPDGPSAFTRVVPYGRTTGKLADSAVGHEELPCRRNGCR
jgi:hypothetical protein